MASKAKAKGGAKAAAAAATKASKLDFATMGIGQKPWVTLAILQPAPVFHKVKKNSITVGA